MVEPLNIPVDFCKCKKFNDLLGDLFMEPSTGVREL